MAKRFKFKRRNFGRIVSRARPIVRAVTGVTLAKRIVFDGVSVPAISATAYDNPLIQDLVECTEAQDEEAETDTSGGIADVPLYSRLLSLKLNLFLQSSAAPGAIRARWLLYKKPDGESLVTNLAGFFHSSDDTPTLREIRKLTLAKGMLPLSNDNLANRLPIFVRRQAWQRASPMRENDKISLVVAQSSNATLTLSGFGTIYARANG